ncbi:MAG: efflux RND transporter periplasmic adaptor subunit [Bryobacterales bacterium]|nr:efflux RND transporter periplasmic adaptor subunit [Bryobacterales bacterium]
MTIVQQRLALAGFLFVVAGCSRQQPVLVKQDTGPIPVRVAPVVTREMRRVVESVGTLFPFEEIIISAEVEGRVDQVNVDLGDQVTPGQIMVRIWDEEQRYLLAQNEAQLRQSLERLGLKDEKDKVKDIRDAPDLRRAQADLFDAEQRYKRMRNLVDQGISSQADLDQASAKFKSLQAAYDSTMYQTRNLIQEVERFKAIVDLQRKKLRDTTVRAPFAAAVKDRQATVGQYVRVNAPLLTLVKIDPIRLRVEVPERMAPWIKNGQMTEVLLEAYGDRVFRGKVWRISPTVEQSKRTFVIEALIDNPGGALKPGSYAKARVPTEKVDRIRLVPVRAVNYVLGSNKTYVVRDGQVDAREVKLGDRFEQDVEILEGVEEGEQVAITQVARLDTGTKVRIATGAEGGKEGQRKKSD